MNARSFTPRHAMILAVIGIGIVSFLAYHWLTAPVLTKAEVTSFTGTVENVRATSGKSAYLEITLAGQSYPFRSFASYPADYQFDLRGRLGRGSTVALGVETAEVNSPRHNWAENQTFYRFITLTIGKDEALTLESHNRGIENNRRFGPWFCLVMALLCMWLFRVGYRHRMAKGSLMEILKPTPTRSGGKA